MTDEPGKQLVPIRPGGALQTTSGAARVVSTAVSDALSIAKTRTEKLTEIGGFQFDEEQKAALAKEIAELEKEAAKLQEEIDNLTGTDDAEIL